MADEFKAEESMAHESMADELKPKESKGDEVYEILKYRKKINGCNINYLWQKNIEISEKKKHVEDLGHDVRHGYIYNYIYI